MSSEYTEKIRALADKTTDPDLADALREIARDPAEAAWEFVKTGVLLGAHERWSGELLEPIAEGFPNVGMPVGTPQYLKGWRQLADSLGYVHDGEEEDQDDAEDPQP